MATLLTPCSISSRSKFHLFAPHVPPILMPYSTPLTPWPSFSPHVPFLLGPCSTPAQPRVHPFSPHVPPLSPHVPRFSSHVPYFSPNILSHSTLHLIFHVKCYMALLKVFINAIFLISLKTDYIYIFSWLPDDLFLWHVVCNPKVVITRETCSVYQQVSHSHVISPIFVTKLKRMTHNVFNLGIPRHPKKRYEADKLFLWGRANWSNMEENNQ